MEQVGITITANDRAAVVLQSVMKSVQSTVKIFDSAGSLSGTIFREEAWVSARARIVDATASLNDYQRKAERLSGSMANPSLPAAPAIPDARNVPDWNRTAGRAIFQGGGEKRFQAEMEAADQMIRQLYQNQSKISERARKMRIIPPGMLNDVASTANRVEMLKTRLKDLNEIPVDLRTETLNNEIEGLREKLGRAAQVQDTLTQSITQMDLSKVNAAYADLNEILGESERLIRDQAVLTEDSEPSGQTEKQPGEKKSFGSWMDEMGKLMDPLEKRFNVVKWAESMYGAAAKLEKTEGAYREAFGGMTQVSDRFISDLRALAPVTEAEARNMAVGIQNALAPAGVGKEEAVGLTGKAMNLAGALSNFSPTSDPAEAAGAIQSALSGNYDSLSGFGIRLSEPAVQQEAVRMGLAASIQEVDAAAQAQAVLSLAYGQSEAALAAFHQETLNSETRMGILKSGFEDALAGAGEILLPRINEFLVRIQQHMPEIAAALSGVAQVFGVLLELAAPAFEGLLNIGAGIAEHWTLFEPIIWGIVGALAAWKIAQFALNLTMLANPIVWIALAIVGVIALIAGWIQSIGGLKVAWLTVVDAFLTGWENLKLAFFTGFYWVLNLLDNLFLTFKGFGTNIRNFLDTLAIHILMTLQDTLNHAIGFINDFISLINGVTGANLSFIEELTFGTTLSIELEAKKEARNKELEEDKGDVTKRMSERDAKLDKMKTDKNYNQTERDLEIDRAKGGRKQTERKKKPVRRKENDPLSGDNIPDYGDMAGGGAIGTASGLGNTAANIGATAANTATMADQMDMAEEDLKSMRDLAEQEAINRFTTAELTVQMGGITNQINSQMDLDGIGDYLGSIIYETLETAAEGVH